MIKSGLAERILAQNPHLYLRDAEKVVNAVLEKVVAAMARGDRVELRGFMKPSWTMTARSEPLKSFGNIGWADRRASKRERVRRRIQRGFLPRASPKIPRLYIEGIDMEVGDVNVSHRMLKRLRIAAVDGGTAAVYRLIPSSRRNHKSLVAAADTAQQVGLIYQMLGDNMNDAVRRLHLAPAREHLRTQNHPTLPVEQGGPDNEVRDVGLVF
jgi:hypothetical protein